MPEHIVSEPTPSSVPPPFPAERLPSAQPPLKTPKLAAAHESTARVAKIQKLALPADLHSFTEVGDSFLADLRGILSSNPYEGWLIGRMSMWSDRLELANLEELLSDLRIQAPGTIVPSLFGALGRRFEAGKLRHNLQRFCHEAKRLCGLMLQRTWRATSRSIVVAWMAFWEGVGAAIPKLIEALIRGMLPIPT